MLFLGDVSRPLEKFCTVSQGGSIARLVKASNKLLKIFFSSTRVTNKYLCTPTSISLFAVFVRANPDMSSDFSSR